jgi:hypothetical protein
MFAPASAEAGDWVAAGYEVIWDSAVLGYVAIWGAKAAERNARRPTPKNMS